MPTVMLTSRCTNSCSWCFADDVMLHYQVRGLSEMSWEAFKYVVDFYERSGQTSMTLLGGEPTLHTRITDILTELSRLHIRSLVLTNGNIGQSILDRLSAVRVEGLRFAVNSTPYFDYPEKSRERVNAFFEQIDYPVILSYTLTSRDSERLRIEPLLDRIALIMKYSLTPHIQFQIAVPSRANCDYVPFNRYSMIYRQLIQWFNILKKNGISFGLDCHSIPKCVIPPEVNERLLDVTSTCQQFMIDIGPDLDVWPCMPLSGERRNIRSFQDFSELRAYYAELRTNQSYVYDPHCGNCTEAKNQTCDSGCLGFQFVR